MDRFCDMRRRLFLPVRRKLMCLSVCWICGILLSEQFTFPHILTGIICALLSACAVHRHMQRRSALFCVSVCMFLAANGLAGHTLALRDLPTAPGVHLSGTVSAVEKPYRVYLSDVHIDGESSPKRCVLVSLMQEEGESVPEVFVGQRVSGTGRLFAPEEPRNPGGINRRIGAINDGYELSGYILPGWTAEGNKRFSLAELFRHIRTSLGAHIDRLFGEHAPLFRGMMLGDRSGMDAELVASMRMTGTVHILTVSGLHLSLIAAIVSRLIRFLPVGRVGGFAIMTAFLSCFAGITGFAAGTVRALIMALIRQLAVITGKRYEPLTALSLAALLMTIYRPVWALDASFQFSFYVVLGIQLLASGARLSVEGRKRVPSLLRRFFAAAGVSASAQLAAVPMQLLLYGYIPLLSLFMNLLCSLMIPVLMLGGWAVSLVGVAGFAQGDYLASLLGAAAGGFENMSLYAASLKGGIIRLPSPYGFAALLFAALMMLLSGRIKWGKARNKAAVLVTMALIVSYLPRIVTSPAYVQLDVGQGDAALFRRGRSAVLFDVGPADSYDMLRYLRYEGLFPEAVILSHLDEDHAGGLVSLAGSEIKIPAIVTAKRAIDEETSALVLEAIGTIAESGAEIMEVSRGDRISVMDINIDVLSPDDALSGSNERSLLLYADMEGVPVLLAGDLPAACEPETVPDCTILKVAHHGSRTATSESFLSMTKPEIAVISVGADNRYGHPTQRVLDDLAAVGSDILRTDQSGCIEFVFHRDGVGIHRYLDANMGVRMME